MKRVGVLVIGGTLLLAGIAMLVLPGPGFVLIAAALAILATKFEWAKKPLDYAKSKAQQGVDEMARSRWNAIFALVCALGLAALGVMELLGINIPFVNMLTAGLLILSGLFLLGTVIYARKQGSSTAGKAEPAGG
ncbi:hypothetical protein EH165_13880 [Nakamurella antarctica]|uniref:Transmembrane protein (PGPGW) n=1 Tax=Nakamurella antarctica TaxID=1902245 RepID=A0A3G8ZPK4_9ACTN|nr:PGPGW domain-containing protein [Nakamurella antarctica]AZI59068.1 hypothetical protein EH165_13880 [Nakamurella antarctica]